MSGEDRAPSAGAAGERPDPVSRLAVEAYHRLLEDDGSAEESIEALREGQRERRLVFGDHPVCVSLRPQLVSAARYREAIDASNAVASALGTLEGALLRDGELRGELDLEPEEERLALTDPGIRFSSPSARIDGFLSDRLRYVEFNAESPAGMGYSDHLAEVFEALPVMRAFRRRFRVRRIPLVGRQIDVMLRSFREWGGRREPAAAIVDWRGLPTVSEHEMFREGLEARGVPTVLADPGELEYRRDRLFAADRPVNLVYRRVLTSELIAAGEEGRALRDAYVEGAVCVVNTFRAKLLHKKMSLALLSDERFARLYTAKQREAIARHVPWTRRVAEGPGTIDGEGIGDLPAFVLANREDLVLKPNDEYGGKGVVLGWTVDAREWEQSLEVALTQSYVVQRAVEVPRGTFPVMAGDEFRHLDLAMDLDPYLFAGRAAGVLTRLSSSSLLNVTAGQGSIVPTYVVEGER